MRQERFQIDSRAVMLGYLADITTTKLFELSLLLILLDPGSASTRPLDRINPALLDGMGLCWGLFFTGLGGFIAARLAPAWRYSHAAMAGLLSTITCIATYGFLPQDASLPLYHLGLVATIPVALAGARIAGLWKPTRS